MLELDKSLGSADVIFIAELARVTKTRLHSMHAVRFTVRILLG